MIGSHQHFAKYITRIINKNLPTQKVGTPPAEILQFICEDDGIIFKEIEIKQI